MRTPVLALAALLTAAAAAPASGADTPENLFIKSEPDPSGGAAGRVQGGIDIPAPPAAVWRVMLDCPKALRIVPKLKSCTIVEGDATAGSDVREHRIAGPLGMVRHVFRSTYVPLRSITTTRVAGDLKLAEGVWRLQPMDGGRATRVSYDSRLAISAPVPGGFVRSAMRRDTPQVLRALRREAVAAAGG